MEAWQNCESFCIVLSNKGCNIMLKDNLSLNCQRHKRNYMLKVTKFSKNSSNTLLTVMQRDDKKLHVKSDYILKELFKHISNSHAT